MPSNIIVLLPVFNEDRNLHRLLRQLDAVVRVSARRYEIVAVDDGSLDRSWEVLTSFESVLPLRIIRHEINKGLGAALKTGIDASLATADAGDILVIMDSDASHSPELIELMAEKLESGYDVAIASRFQHGAGVMGVPRHRRALSAGASMFFRLFFPTSGVRDFTCGYRAYRIAAVHAAALRYEERLVEYSGFQCMVDLLLKLRATGATFTELPLCLRYDLKQGESKMRVGATIIRTLGVAWRHRRTALPHGNK